MNRLLIALMALAACLAVVTIAQSCDTGGWKVTDCTSTGGCCCSWAGATGYEMTSCSSTQGCAALGGTCGGSVSSCPTGERKNTTCGATTCCCSYTSASTNAVECLPQVSCNYLKGSCA